MIRTGALQLAILGGILCGLGCASFFFAVFSSALLPPQVRFFDIWIPLVFGFFFLIQIRNRTGEPAFHFWQGLMYGNMLIWIAGLVSGLSLWALASAEPEFFRQFLAGSVRYITEADKVAPEALKTPDLPGLIRTLEATPPSSLVWDEVKKKVLYSFVISPLLAVLLRRK